LRWNGFTVPVRLPLGLAIAICVAIFAIFAPITMRIYKNKQ